MGKSKDSKPKTRSPIVSVLGHVDHGKSSVLDAIRGSNIIASEAGAITQAIGASIIPLETIKKSCGELLESMGQDFTIPGLLFIDTPGHAAFTGLRKRGGALADIAILVVDINEGFKPQTREAIDILKATKTPFVVAANKLDLIPHYQRKHENILKDLKSQDPKVIQAVETRLYSLVGLFHEEYKMPSERFDRVDDFTTQLAIVPVSALKGWGIPELLVVLTGLAQKYLEQRLAIDVSGPGKGTVLEVKETKGLGTTIDVILYDGIIRRNDTIVIGGLDEPIVTRIRALLEPDPNAEMRDKKAKFKPVQEASAAMGVKVAAPELDDVIPGMPVRVASKESLDAVKEAVQSEVENTLVTPDKDGIIIKADTLGSLEALQQLLKENDVTVRKAGIGPVSKRDLADAESNEDPLKKVILGFNIPEAKHDDVKIFTAEVIYQLIDEYTAWRESEQKRYEAEKLKDLVRPCRVEILQSCLFRASNPCIAGVEVLAGVLTTSTPLMKQDGTRLSVVKSIERESKSVPVADKGLQVAISLPGVVAEKHINEFDILISDIPESDFIKLKGLREHLTKEEVDIMREVADLKRKQNPVWGV